MRYYSLQYKDKKKLLTLFNVCHLYCFVRFECARFENMELGVTRLHWLLLCFKGAQNSFWFSTEECNVYTYAFLTVKWIAIYIKINSYMLI